MSSEKFPSNSVTTPEEPVTTDIFDLMTTSIANESNPLFQLDNLHDMSELLKTTHLGDKEVKELSSTLESASSKDDNTPLISLSLTYLKDCIAIDYSHDSRAKAKISKHFIDDLQNQDQLHKDYPTLPGDHIIVRLAPGIAYSLNDYHEMESTAFKGEATTIPEGADSQESPFIALLRQDADMPIWVLNFAHDVRFRGLIEENLGLDLAEIPLDSQAQLLKFMAKANDGRFNRLCETLHSIPNEKLRLKFAENFLATDFGDDFGDALLDIANSEKISNEQLAEMLDTVSSCRKSIRDITDFYRGFDNGNFADEYARASNERLTDAIMVFREIATKGEAKADLGWPGEISFNYDSAIEALNYEAKSLEIISGTLNDVAGSKEGAFAELVLSPDADRQRSLYSFYSPSHGYVLLYTRPEGAGSFDSAFEYGKNRSRYDKTSGNVGVEASISLMTNPVDPFSLPNPFRPNAKAAKNPRFYDSGTMDKVSALRLDREGRAPGASADDPNRDPVNPAGMVSVDLAAIGDRADTPSGKIARLLSVGGVLRASNDDSALNHNTHWFDQAKYGTDKGFKRLVDYIDTMAKEWCAKHPSGKDEGFRGVARAINKNRGKRIGRMVA